MLYNIFPFRILSYAIEMSGSSKGGRPVGTRLISKGLSKTQVKCVVCSLERRGDKIKDHQVHSVLFDSEGNPADSSHPRYESLSESKKEHTDYFRINGYKRAAVISTLEQYRREVEMLDEDDDEPDVTAEDIVVEELPVENYALYKELKAESNLKDLCKDLCAAYDERVSVSDVMKKAINIFCKDDLSWFKTNSAEVEEEDCIDNTSDEENHDHAEKIMKELIDSWNQQVSNSYDTEKLAQGYCCFVEFRKSQPRDVNLETIYSGFIRKYGQLDITAEFRDMFERIQIKSCSEAVCETVGSIMKIAKGKGRNCLSVNFSKEIKLCYNLPPLHVLSKSFIPEIVKTLTSHKEFFRKGDKKSQSILSRLKSTSLSASLYNFREEEEKKSKLPVDLFK